MVIRQNGNSLTHYNIANEIVFTNRNIKFESRKSENFLANRLQEETSLLPNSNIGVFDLETFEQDGFSKQTKIKVFCALSFFINSNFIIIPYSVSSFHI